MLKLENEIKEKIDIDLKYVLEHKTLCHIEFEAIGK